MAKQSQWMLRLKPYLALLVLCVVTAPVQSNELIWHWQDHFSAKEKQKLQSWVKQTQTAVEKTVGPYPFDLHVYFFRSKRSNEPVPWANTQREYGQGLHFHVSPGFSLQRFLEDWTGPHEFSHLILPYVGGQHAWFSEGFASYMQYRVMHQLAVLNQQEMKRRYQGQIRKLQRARAYHHSTLPNAQQEMKRRGDYPRLYWGGAVYFMEVERLLAEAQKPTLSELLARYMRCCRKNTDTPENIVADLDALSRSNIFSQQFDRFNQQTGTQLPHANFWQLM